MALGLFLFLILVLPQTAWTQISIDIHAASGKKLPIAIVALQPLNGETHPRFKSFGIILERDLRMTGLFQAIGQGSFLEPPNAGLQSADTQFPLWQKSGADALVKGGYKKSLGKWVLELRLFDVFRQEMILGKRYSFSESDLEQVAHTFADQIILKLTGEKGVFGNTRILCIGKAEKSKELFEMKPDGSGLRQVTQFKSITLSPDWSRDGKTIGFTSYRAKNPDFYLMEAKSGTLRMLSNKPGLNFGVAFSPVQDLLLLAVSNDSDSEIVLMNLKGQLLRQLTNNFWIDIEPSWSPDGKLIAFVSNQSGQPHIYRMASDGSGLKRLTYQGYHNVSPAWSPKGNKIAFAGRDQGAFDIFIMDSDGQNIQRLTINQGNNESPSWAPNGQMIAFSSTRTGREQIFVMGQDGRGQTQITDGFAPYSQPAWSPIIE